MPPVAEPIEIRKNNFSTWLYRVLVLLSLFAFIISFNQPGSNKWICLGGVVFFGAGLILNNSQKILVDQQGMSIKNMLGTKTINWSAITSLQYEMISHGHGIQYVLKIKHGTTGAVTNLPVKQYKRAQVVRLLEILDEQSPLALKNDAFKKLAGGQLDWKAKLKMLRS